MVSRSSKVRISASLGKLGWEHLPYARKLDTLRLVEVLFNRFGPPDDETSEHIVSELDKSYPAKGRELNVELCNLMVYLKAPSVAAKTLPLIESAPTQEEQMDLARTLRTLKGRLDARPAAGVFLVDRESGRLQGGAKPVRILQADQGRRTRDPDRIREGRPQADP